MTNDSSPTSSAASPSQNRKTPGASNLQRHQDEAEDQPVPGAQSKTSAMTCSSRVHLRGG